MKKILFASLLIASLLERCLMADDNYYCGPNNSGITYRGGSEHKEILCQDGYFFTDYKPTFNGGELKYRKNRKPTMCAPRRNEIEATLRPKETTSTIGDNYCIEVGVGKTKANLSPDLKTERIVISLQDANDIVLSSYQIDDFDSDLYKIKKAGLVITMNNFNYRHSFDLNNLLDDNYEGKITINIDYCAHSNEKLYIRTVQVRWDVSKRRTDSDYKYKITFDNAFIRPVFYPQDSKS